MGETDKKLELYHLKGSKPLNERDLLNTIKEATGHPNIQPIDLGLSGRVLIDHVIGRFESAINDNGGYGCCPQIIREGYDALKQLYRLDFQNIGLNREFR